MVPQGARKRPTRQSLRRRRFSREGAPGDRRSDPGW